MVPWSSASPQPLRSVSAPTPDARWCTPIFLSRLITGGAAPRVSKPRSAGAGRHCIFGRIPVSSACSANDKSATDFERLKKFFRPDDFHLTHLLERPRSSQCVVVSILRSGERAYHI